jgi:hypothetical protein
MIACERSNNYTVLVMQYLAPCIYTYPADCQYEVIEPQLSLTLADKQSEEQESSSNPCKRPDSDAHQWSMAFVWVTDPVVVRSSHLVLAGEGQRCGVPGTSSGCGIRVINENGRSRLKSSFHDR